MRLIITSLALLALSLLMAQDPARHRRAHHRHRQNGAHLPGATVPSRDGTAQPGHKDTIPYEMNGKYNPDVYRYCAGYQYQDPTITGFSHTHFSGNRI